MFTKRKRILTARFLLVLMVFQLVAPSVAKAGGGSPASNQLLDYVDPFTGDFHYGIPLLTVPGPNGENVPISLSYGAGITMDQEASWVGLGWNLNPGEITREVNGAPDDWNRVTINRDTYDNTGFNLVPISEPTNFYGPLYFKNFPPTPTANDAMDIYQTDRLMRYSLFEFPDYDNYYVSGPGMGGEMSPFLFDYSTLKHKPTTPTDIYTAMTDAEGAGCRRFSKNAEFLFKGELPSKVLYGKDSYTPPLKDGNLASSTFLFAEPLDYAQADNYKGTYDNYSASSNHVQSSKYVEYFTNSDLNINLPQDFLDYRTIGNAVARRGAEFPADGIGAFRITNADGYTYHYSLPVYAYNEVQRSFNLDDSGNPITNFIAIDQKPDAYAASWKLTAITGPDFRDNGDHVAGDGDKGYWIAFDYGLWANDFPWSLPFYGFTNDQLGSILPSKLKTSATNALSYQKKGSVALGHKQIYYLNSIKTATHTAYFIKDQRDDAHSTQTSAVYVPKMLLKKIVLIRNEDAQGLLAPNGNDALPQNKFAGSGAGLGNVVHTGNYNAHKSAVDNASLKTIEFTYDYSLCPQLDNNINNTFSSSPVSISFSPAYQRMDTHTYDAANGGKLTLKSVKQLERSYTQVFPDYLFEYAQNVAYSHNKTDFWGFYKSDAMSPSEGKYTTLVSSTSLDKWSLTKVTTPIGSQIAVKYEADRYERVGYSGSEESMGYPTRVFPLKQYDRVTNTYSFYDPNDANLFLHSNNSFTRVVIPSKTVCGLSALCSNLLHPHGIDYNSVLTLPNYYLFQAFAGSLGDFNPQPNSCYSGCTNFSYDPNFSLGYVSTQLSQAYGGGIRVSEISLTDPNSGTSYKNVYSYANGIATTEPDRFGVPTGTSVTRSNFSGERHLLPPSVGYTNVTITPVNQAGTSIGSLAYTFRNYQESFFPAIDRNDRSFIDGSTTNVVLVQNIRVDENNSIYGKTI